MDAARCAKRLGAENVYIVYRRGMEEMPARREEVEHAQEAVSYTHLDVHKRQHVDRYGNVIGCIKGSRPGPRILFDGHIDTVPVGDPSTL